MVLESLINPKKAEKKPWEMFFVGLVYSSIAILMSLWIFKDYASLVFVFFTVLACTHFIYIAIEMEEEKDKIATHRMFIKEHSGILSFLVFLFLGFVVSFTLWYVFLPSTVVSSLFSIQQETISAINSKVTGSFTETLPFIGKIFFNNIKVMIFCLLFSFFYGIGAIFILTWNASVIGTAIGNFIRSSMHNGIFSAFSLGFLRYLTHGIPEILAYFMAGLAGGIISIAIIKHEFGSGKFKNVLADSVDLIIGSVVVLFIAALIEVYVTPLLL